MKFPFVYQIQFDMARLIELWSKLYNKTLSGGLESDEGPGPDKVQGVWGSMTHVKMTFYV